MNSNDFQLRKLVRTIRNTRISYLNSYDSTRSLSYDDIQEYFDTLQKVDLKTDLKFHS